MFNSLKKSTRILAASVVMFAAAIPASAEMLQYSANLKASSETPANDSKGVGTLEATYDTSTMKLNWTVVYSGLTGPATAAHYHGPAATTATAPPVVPIAGPLATPMKGEVILTKAQFEEIKAGMWYFNIHTAAHKDGEIRGQLEPK